jgi:hypothetical protein
MKVKDTLTQYPHAAHYGYRNHLDMFGADVSYDWLDGRDWRETTHLHEGFSAKRVEDSCT